MTTYEVHPLLQPKGHKPRTGKIKLCLQCGKEVYRRPSEISKKYCSLTCYNKAQTKRGDSHCKHCGAIYWVSPSMSLRQKYCSVECYREAAPNKPKKVGTRRKGMLSRVQHMAQMYARLRDCGGKEGYARCISCSANKPFAELDGGHFIPGTHSALRFDERNINAQCIKCNRFLHGNQWHYAQGMVDKYGQATLNEFASREHDIKKWTYGELLELYEYYREGIASYNE